MVRNKYFLHAFAFLVMLLMCGNTFAKETTTERVLWDKRPIPFALTVGDERLVHFPVEVRYWIPTSIEDAVSILAANGVLYISAHREFEKTRIRVQSLVSQKVYLLDLSASADNSVTDEIIVMDSEYIDNKSMNDTEEQPVFDWFIRLTRFAAQSLYAKERLLPADSDIRSIRVDTQTPIALVRGGDIESIPVKSWRGGGYYVTAVRIRNLSNDDIVITHSASNGSRLIQRTIILSEDIRGDWLAVTPQHTTLNAAGNEDITTLYLLSDHAFTESF